MYGIMDGAAGLFADTNEIRKRVQITMIALKPYEFHTVSDLFADIDHNIALVHAVIEGNIPGRIYRSGAEPPACALVCLPAGNAANSRTLFSTLGWQALPQGPAHRWPHMLDGMQLAGQTGANLLRAQRNPTL